MYPVELEIKDTTERNISAPYLDLLLLIWGTINFILPFMTNMTISISGSQIVRSWEAIYQLHPPCVLISQLIRYTQACSSYECIILRTTRLSNMLFEQALEMVIEEVYGGYGDPIKQSSSLTNAKWLSVVWPNKMTTPTDQTIYQSVTFLPNSTFYWLMRGFHKTFETDVACWQETLTPPDTWSRPIWDLHMFYMYLFRPFLNLP